MLCKSFKKIAKFIWEQIGVILMIIPVFIISRIDFSVDANNYDPLKDKIELMSWIFAGITALLGFLSLFIAFIYENKIIAAARYIRKIYFPYGQTDHELRDNLLNYRVSVNGNLPISFIYWFFVFSGGIIIFVWGLSAGFYTKFENPFGLIMQLGSVLNIGIYLFVIMLSTAIVLVSVYINFIRLKRDPIGQGNLPKYEDLHDIDFLISNGADIDEYFLVNTPRLEFFANPPISSPVYEVKFVIPINVKGLRFVMKIYNENHIVVTVYGVLFSDFSKLSQRFSMVLNSNLDENTFKSLVDTTSGEIKIYDNTLGLIARLSMGKLTEENGSFAFVAKRSIEHRDKIENDHGYLASMTDNKTNVVFRA